MANCIFGIREPARKERRVSHRFSSPRFVDIKAPSLISFLCCFVIAEKQWLINVWFCFVICVFLQTVFCGSGTTSKGGHHVLGQKHAPRSGVGGSSSTSRK